METRPARLAALIERSLRPAARSLVTGLAELLLPATCAACRALTHRGEPFCESCTALIEAVASPCPRCGLPLPPSPPPSPLLSSPPLSPLPPSSPAPPLPSPSSPRSSPASSPRSGPSCLGCLQSPPPWSAARAPMVFAGPIAIAIRRWKLGAEPALSPALGSLLAPSLARTVETTGGELLVPVPLHPRRLRQREFNQASLLARAARARSGCVIPVEEALDRVVDTPPQSRLPAKARRDNVRRAFRVPRPATVRGRHVLLVDDVVTTGSTASACAITLLEAGAARVDLVALARALP